MLIFALYQTTLQETVIYYIASGFRSFPEYRKHYAAGAFPIKTVYVSFRVHVRSCYQNRLVDR